MKRIVDRACKDWSVGELERAISGLQPLLESATLPPEAIYVLARARSERGEWAEGLSTLDHPTNPPSDPRVVKLFRGLILRDHDRVAEATAQLADLARTNPIAAAVLALIDFDADATRTELSLPRAAGWMAEVSGRLLAILESRLVAQGDHKLTEFHRSLFLPVSLKPKDPIEAAFLECRYGDVERLGTDLDSIGASGIDCLVFSLLALGKDEPAGRVLAKVLEEIPASADLHFLSGLRHSRFTRRRDAGWSFVRAARLADVDIGDVIGELSQKLDVTIRLTD